MKRFAALVLMMTSSFTLPTSVSSAAGAEPWQGPLAREIISILISSNPVHRQSLESFSYVKFAGGYCERKQNLAASAYTALHGLETYSCYKNGAAGEGPSLESSGLLYSYLEKIGLIEIPVDGGTRITVPAMFCRVWPGYPLEDSRRFVCDLN